VQVIALGLLLGRPCGATEDTPAEGPSNRIERSLQVRVVEASTRVHALLGRGAAELDALRDGWTRPRCLALREHAADLDAAFAELESAWREWQASGPPSAEGAAAQVTGLRRLQAQFADSVQARCFAVRADAVPGAEEPVRRCEAANLAFAPGFVAVRLPTLAWPSSPEQTLGLLEAVGRQVVTSATHVVLIGSEPPPDAGASPAAFTDWLSEARRTRIRFSGTLAGGSSADDWPRVGIIGLADLEVTWTVPHATALRDGLATWTVADTYLVPQSGGPCEPRLPGSGRVSDLGGVTGGARSGSWRVVGEGVYRGEPVGSGRIGALAGAGGVTPFAPAELFVLRLAGASALPALHALEDAVRVGATEFTASGMCTVTGIEWSRRARIASRAASSWRLLAVVPVGRDEALDSPRVEQARRAWRAWTATGPDAEPERLNLFEASGGLWRPLVAEVIPRAAGCEIPATASPSAR
jgi:hypothetical protein